MRYVRAEVATKGRSATNQKENPTMILPSAADIGFMPMDSANDINGS
jgi:hypothetical protein